MEEERIAPNETGLYSEVSKVLTKNAKEYGYIIDYQDNAHPYQEIELVMNNGAKTYEFSIDEFQIFVKVLIDDKVERYMLTDNGIYQSTPPPTPLSEDEVLRKMWSKTRLLHEDEANTLLSELVNAEPDIAAIQEDFKKISSYREFDGSVITWAKEQEELPFNVPTLRSSMFPQ